MYVNRGGVRERGGWSSLKSKGDEVKNTRNNKHTWKQHKQTFANKALVKTFGNLKEHFKAYPDVSFHLQKCTCIETDFQI